MYICLCWALLILLVWHLHSPIVKGLVILGCGKCEGWRNLGSLRKFAVVFPVHLDVLRNGAFCGHLYYMSAITGCPHSNSNILKHWFSKFSVRSGQTSVILLWIGTVCFIYQCPIKLLYCGKEGKNGNDCDLQKSSFFHLC